MKIHKFSAVLATAAVAAGSGIGIAQARTSGDTSTPTTTTRSADAQKGKRGGPGKGMRAADLKALGAKLGVSVERLQAAMDATRPAKPAAGERPKAGARPDESKLVSALATGLKLDRATVQAALEKLHAAHEAEHEARHAAMAAALAKELGLSTEKVQSALEATRPAKPAGR